MILTSPSQVRYEKKEQELSKLNQRSISHANKESEASELRIGQHFCGRHNVYMKHQI